MVSIATNQHCCQTSARGALPLRTIHMTCIWCTPSLVWLGQILRWASKHISLWDRFDWTLLEFSRRRFDVVDDNVIDLIISIITSNRFRDSFLKDDIPFLCVWGVKNYTPDVGQGQSLVFLENALIWSLFLVGTIRWFHSSLCHWCVSDGIQCYFRYPPKPHILLLSAMIFQKPFTFYCFRAELWKDLLFVLLIA